MATRHERRQSQRDASKGHVTHHYDVDQTIVEPGPRRHAYAATVSRRIGERSYQDRSVDRLEISRYSYVHGIVDAPGPHGRETVRERSAQPARVFVCDSAGLAIKSDARYSGEPSFARPSQIDRSRLSANCRFDGSVQISRQAERAGEIVRASERQQSENCPASSQGLKHVMQGAVASRHQQPPDTVIHGPARPLCQVFRAVAELQFYAEPSSVTPQRVEAGSHSAAAARRVGEDSKRRTILRSAQRLIQKPLLLEDVHGVIPGGRTSARGSTGIANLAC